MLMVANVLGAIATLASALRAISKERFGRLFAIFSANPALVYQLAGRGDRFILK